ncbi:glycine--tRNA ligase beta subunit [Jannaschia pagri]|uniref:Glycine--tRNA ligase beta subunit n=1 Tax=Jannaschia pagri TaxID=2829797 RepID=A0ABQ4NGJ9_9RHOB|nr:MULTISPECIES: glycine--tRNA ligase subunit beta [unclassified Jannaschia]GIT90351.1 glycine--tRNA ligase beta subunit [Jannaschia sp. AI_61]GIT93543.1 glycine--tRNA ligase beta subunit [Jannaschia sp. AI_62]
MPDLLIELFSEEIPARMQRRAAADLQKLMTDGLVDAGLTYAGAVAHVTPRRLALSVQGLTAESPTTTETRRGPRVDAPQKALDGFLRSTGLTREQLEEQDDKKGRVFIAKITQAGRPADAIVADVLDKIIRTFPWPKSMRWGAGSLRWVRPLRRILCILSDEDGARVVPLDVDGIVSGDMTEGHRFMAPEPFRVTSFDDYEAKLKRSRVVLSSQERAEAIWQDATNQAFAAGLEVVEDAGLLAEVAGLVEWPVVLMGKIGADFLELPPEVLQTSMKEHQKFFSVRDKAGKITRFITVANRETADDGATILAGNDRVLSARLADAKFFWENDLRVAKSSVEPWLDALSNVTFHAKLGSQKTRIERIAALARELAPTIGADPDLAERAAQIAKADLSSEMVYEFPELQGLMGRYYAEAAGEDPAVAAACQDHYCPLGPSDDVPTAPVSVTVALADKLDTLAGFWAIDEKPTGSKDPYALRRAALGVIRLVLSGEISTKLLALLRVATENHLAWFTSHDEPLDPFDGIDEADLGQEQRQVKRQALYQKGEYLAARAEKIRAWTGLRISCGQQPTELLSFFHDRLKVYLRDEGVRHDVIDACLTGERTDDLADLTARARALNAFLGTENGENLLQGYKRAANILSQAEENGGVEYSYGADPKLAETEEERALFAALATTKPGIDAALSAEDYPAAMQALATLRGPIDAFFEAVQVNADNDIVRRNRLNMLSEIVRTGEKIADLTRVGA